jgi:hypothetical protein
VTQEMYVIPAQVARAAAGIGIRLAEMLNDRAPAQERPQWRWREGAGADGCDLTAEEVGQ